MRYNVLARERHLRISLFNITEEELQIVVDSYLRGAPKLTISGTTYEFNDVTEFQIITNEAEIKREIFTNDINELASGGGRYFGPYYEPVDLEKYGTNKTKEFIGHNGYGVKKQIEKAVAVETLYVNPKRIEELKSIQSPDFDLSRLISMCKELNDNWLNENYFSVALLVRSIINHIPPAFGDFKTFDQVSAQYGGVSFKKSIKPLNEWFRGIADGYAHGLLRKKEPLPSIQQVDFRQSFDVLIMELIAILHQ